MEPVVVGVNHRSAPVELREQMALAGDGLRAALAAALHELPADEAVILSTCNRLELYLVGPEPHGLPRPAVHFLAQWSGLDPTTLQAVIYSRRGSDAVRHLLRVAAGLDSQILGESQILGQVREALETAQAVGTAGKVLVGLFQAAIHTGKRARHETAIGRSTTSVSHVAVELALSQVSGEADPRVLLVGAGEMVHLALKALRHREVRRIGCVNRTLTRAQAMMAPVDGRAFPWSRLAEALAWADVVISGTGAPHTVIDVGDVASVLPERQGRPLVFVDMAVPRDVDPALDGLDGVVRLDIDDLRATLDANLARRRAAIPAVEAIVAEEEARFMAWLQAQSVAPLIRSLRQQVREMADQELALALRRLSRLSPEERAVVEKLVHRLVNKFLHRPTVQLREAAAEEQGHRMVQAAALLFGLEPGLEERANGSAGLREGG